MKGVASLKEMEDKEEKKDKKGTREEEGKFL